MGNGPALYQRAHKELKRLRGEANEHTCSCGKPARDWAYQFTAGDAELRNPDGSRPYSSNPDDYAAMCRKCHLRFDTEHDPEMAVRRQEGIARGRVKALEKVAEKRKTDPEYVERMNKVLRDNLAVQVRCNECGLISTRPGMGNHKKHSGHQGYSLVTDNRRKELS